jgi:metal-sulfur cluster biosynthetic enzyme
MERREVMKTPATVSRATLRRAVRRQLNLIIDPCSVAAGAPVGIVEFGLVPRVRLTEAANGRWRVGVTIRLTEPGCVMAGPFGMRAQEVLSALGWVDAIDVHVDNKRLWTEADISTAYAIRLDASRQARAIPIRISA